MFSSRAGFPLDLIDWQFSMTMRRGRSCLLAGSLLGKGLVGDYVAIG